MSATFLYSHSSERARDSEASRSAFEVCAKGKIMKVEKKRDGVESSCFVSDDARALCVALCAFSSRDMVRYGARACGIRSSDPRDHGIRSSEARNHGIRAS